MQINVDMVMSTRSDWGVMRHISEVLASLRVVHEVRVMAIHRKPERLQEVGKQASEKGADLLIVGAKDIEAIKSSMPTDMSLPVMLVSTSSENRVKKSRVSCVLLSSDGDAETVPLKYSDSIRSALFATDMPGQNIAI